MSGAVRRVQVELGDRSYPIDIGEGLLTSLSAWLPQLRRVTHASVITDSNVGNLFGDAVRGPLAMAGIRAEMHVVPAGEPSKCAAVAERLWDDLLTSGADRRTLVIALGGGVVGDLAGFVAATFARGLDLVQIPTTLLAQVDSSVGGKVGVNLPSAKNMVGAFWQPLGVMIDLEVLRTLPDREYRAGLAEVVKYGVILDAEFFDFLEANVERISRKDPTVLQHVVARCCELKAEVVRQDERETTGFRAVLNYGHTFAHAFEALMGYGQLLHGEAVAIGMQCAARLAEKLGRVPAGFARRQGELLAQFGLPAGVPELDPRQALDVMSHDKKVEHGKLRFILPDRWGHVELVGDVPNAEVLSALE